MAVLYDVANKYPAFNLTPQTGNYVHRVNGADWQMKLARAWDAYNGQYPNPLKIVPGAPNDNVTLNVARTVVDKSVSFLFGRGVTFNLDKEQTRSEKEKYVDKVWRASQADVFLQRLGTNGAIFGQAFLKIRNALPVPKLIVLDPRNVAVETAHDDYSEVNLYAICWYATDSQTRKKRAFRQLIRRVPAVSFFDENGAINNKAQHWTITDQTAEVKEYQQIAEKDWVTINAEVWPWWFAPIMECQNLPAPNDYWGVSDIEPDVIALVEAINRVQSNIYKILRNHAHPKTIVIGLDEGQSKKVVSNPDGVLYIPGDKTVVDIKNLEMQSDLASSLNYLKYLREAAYELSRTPEVASGKVQDLSYLSGYAMDILYGPAKEKVQLKQITYGGLIIETNRRLLTMAGQGDDHVGFLVWPDTFPRDKQVESVTAVNKQKVGFSSDTLIAEMGGDPGYERARRQADLVETVEQEGAIAEATQPPAQPPRAA